MVSHGEETRRESAIVLTEDEIVDLRKRENLDLFAKVLFLSCCRLGADQRLMRRILDVSGVLAVFSYTRDVDDYQAFISESLFYHLAYGFVRGKRSSLSLREVYEKLKFSLDYLGIDESTHALARPLLWAELAPEAT